MTNIQQGNSFILDPISTDDFLKNHWQEYKSLHINRGLPNYFQDLITLDEIDRLICSCRIPPSNINLARNNDPLPISSYCVGNLVNSQKVLAKHAEGATIILRSIEQWSPAFAKIRCEAERLFGFECQINVYLTPAQEKSTPPHWDTHDLFVLQLEGSKLWRLFSGDCTLPLETERFMINADFVGDLTGEVLLNAGDTFFLPRGEIHEPVAHSYSIHVSIGIRSIRWLDICLNTLQVAASQYGSPLRKTVDFNTATVENVIQQFTDVIGDINPMKQALAETYRQQKDHQWIDYTGALLQLIKSPMILDLHAYYNLRMGYKASFEFDGDRLKLCLENQEYIINSKMHDAILRILKGTPFSFSELATLNLEEKTAIYIIFSEAAALTGAASNEEHHYA